MTRTCQPASAMLPPELAPIKVGLRAISGILNLSLCKDIPKTNCDIACVHTVLSIMFLDLVQVLNWVSKNDLGGRKGLSAGSPKSKLLR